MLQKGKEALTHAWLRWEDSGWKRQFLGAFCNVAYLNIRWNCPAVHPVTNWLFRPVVYTIKCQ